MEEMFDFGKSDKMIKIRGKVDKPNTYYGFSSNISFSYLRKILKTFFLE